MMFSAANTAGVRRRLMRAGAGAMMRRTPPTTINGAGRHHCHRHDHHHYGGAGDSLLRTRSIVTLRTNCTTMIHQAVRKTTQHNNVLLRHQRHRLWSSRRSTDSSSSNNNIIRIGRRQLVCLSFIPSSILLWHTVSRHNNASSLNDNNDHAPSLLCTSPGGDGDTLVVIVDDDDDEDRFSRRWIRWCRHIIETCWDLILLTIRGTQVACQLSPLLVLTPASITMTHLMTPNHPLASALCDASWDYFRYSMQALGPVFVKLCQWVATRRDMFPPHVCDRLALLHDGGRPHAWRHSHAMLCAAFGDAYAAQGLHVNHDDIIGCGSAAQVYSGTLSQPTEDEENDNNSVSKQRDVAIKILHPHFEVLVRRDLALMESVANLIHRWAPFEYFQMLNLPHATENFATLLHQQADLRYEGANLKRFRANFYHGDEDEEAASAITFPQPIDDWMSREVLVEELVTDAVPIAEYLLDTSEEGIRVRRQLASPLLRAFLKMVFLDIFVHSDLHPGNVLVKTSVVSKTPSSNSWFWNTTKTKDPTASSEKEEKEVLKRTIVFLDAGIATSLCPEDQRNLKDLFRAVILNDGYTAGQLMVERAKYERCSQTEGGVDAFAQGIEDLVAEFHDRRMAGLTLGAVRIGSLLCRVLDLCRIHHVEIDPSMASIVISTLVLEGLGRSLDPNLNLIDFAVPFVLSGGRV